MVAELRPDACDINMGCPANNVLKGCAAAALMGDLDVARQIIAAVRRRVPMPLTVKFRLGLDEARMNYLELGRICEGEGADGVVLHARTARQMFRGEAAWEHIGRLKRALAMFGRAHLLLTPDSGPMHMANAVGTAVLGLHAASNPDRSGPYSDRRWCVNRYDDAARAFLGKPAAELSWGAKIEKPGVMDLIAVDDVVERLEAFAAERGF